MYFSVLSQINVLILNSVIKISIHWITNMINVKMPISNQRGKYFSSWNKFSTYQNFLLKVMAQKDENGRVVQVTRNIQWMYNCSVPETLLHWVQVHSKLHLTSSLRIWMSQWICDIWINWSKSLPKSKAHQSNEKMTYLKQYCNLPQ